jgi:hypothetical protein
LKISGGDKLKARLAEIAQNASKAATVEIGFLEGSTYPDGTSVPLVAAMDEFGNEKSPARPFFRDMIQAKSEEWPGTVGDLLVANDFDAERTLEQTGAAIKGQLQESISTFVGTPLSPKTIARKGHEKQLIDSSVMLNSADYRVK